jgi:hypothetical protein
VEQPPLAGIVAPAWADAAVDFVTTDLANTPSKKKYWKTIGGVSVKNLAKALGIAQDEVSAALLAGSVGLIPGIGAGWTLPKYAKVVSNAPAPAGDAVAQAAQPNKKAKAAEKAAKRAFGAATHPYGRADLAAKIGGGGASGDASTYRDFALSDDSHGSSAEDERGEYDGASESDGGDTMLALPAAPAGVAAPSAFAPRGIPLRAAAASGAILDLPLASRFGCRG